MHICHFPFYFSTLVMFEAAANCIKMAQRRVPYLQHFFLRFNVGCKVRSDILKHFHAKLAKQACKRM